MKEFIKLLLLLTAMSLVSINVWATDETLDDCNKITDYMQHRACLARVLTKQHREELTEKYKSPELKFDKEPRAVPQNEAATMNKTPAPKGFLRPEKPDVSKLPIPRVDPKKEAAAAAAAAAGSGATQKDGKWWSWESPKAEEQSSGVDQNSSGQKKEKEHLNIYQ